jgi:hypothetical protein
MKRKTEFTTSSEGPVNFFTGLPIAQQLKWISLLANSLFLPLYLHTFKQLKEILVKILYKLCWKIYVAQILDILHQKADAKYSRDIMWESLKARGTYLISQGPDCFYMEMGGFSTYIHHLKVGCLHPVACTRSGSGFPSNATLVLNILFSNRYISLYLYKHTNKYIYIYIERERETEREWEIRSQCKAVSKNVQELTSKTWWTSVQKKCAETYSYVSKFIFKLTYFNL